MLEQKRATCAVVPAVGFLVAAGCRRYLFSVHVPHALLVLWDVQKKVCILAPDKDFAWLAQDEVGCRKKDPAAGSCFPNSIDLVATALDLAIALVEVTLACMNSRC
jgi:hypothetical protein